MPTAAMATIGDFEFPDDLLYLLEQDTWVRLDDDGSATPTVGPDGDVYYGVLAGNGSDNHYRGFLLHFSYGFDSTKQQFAVATKLPGAFGWDDTASIVAALR